jgi:hypothetical protein
MNELPTSETADTDVEPTTVAATPRRAGMTRTLVNFWLDLCLLIVFVSLLWVSAVLRFVFPARVDATGWTLWGGDIIAWRNLQFSILALLAAGVTLHVMLHWSWVCGVINKQLLRRRAIKSDGSDTLIGVGLIAVILHIIAIGVLWASWTIQHPAQ